MINFNYIYYMYIYYFYRGGHRGRTGASHS